MNNIAKLILCANLIIFCTPLHATWQCKVTHPKKNYIWIGTGETRVIAMQNAISVCRKNSSPIQNCRNVGCLQK